VESELEPIRIGVSSCLLGAMVRFDGGHKKDDFLTNTFGAWVEWVPVCPEVEVGMGTPRESVRLERSEEAVRMVALRSGTDWTTRMRDSSARLVRALETKELCGYVLKKDSPSCGMERVRLYGEGMPMRSGRGLFAQALLAHFPHLPVEEEGSLCDPRLRDNFVERVFAYRRLRTLFAPRWSVGALVAFHTAHKLQLMAHSPAAYRALGRLVATAREAPHEQLRDDYRELFMEGLRQLATIRRNLNVLQHIAGYFKRLLEPEDKQELHAVLADYAAGLVPLVVPITLIRHHVRVHVVTYLADQTYLEPHPKELMLRNHV
jgi:uncharacterized protein YbgA (DUF1722 family)/uncharacterized protein YbbK (DUF523 family)